MPTEYKLNENIVYIDQKGTIGCAERLYIINLDDYTQEARDAFHALPQGDTEAFRRWANKYGYREVGKQLGGMIEPKGFSTVATPALLQYLENARQELLCMGYEEMPLPTPPEN